MRRLSWALTITVALTGCKLQLIRDPSTVQARVKELAVSLGYLSSNSPTIQVNSEAREISIAGINPGMPFMFTLEEEGAVTSSLQCTGLSAYAQVVANSRFYVHWGIRTTPGSEVFDCSTSSGAVQLTLSYSASPITLLSGVAPEMTAGGNDEPSLSADGNWVVWTVSGLVWNSSAQQVVAKHLPTDQLVIVSSPDGAAPGNDDSYSAQITPDGRYVVFGSKATNLVSGVSGNQLYRKDLSSPSSPPVLVSSVDGTAAGASTADGSHAPAITPDGRYIAFLSSSPNFVAGTGNWQVFRKDMNNLAVAPVLASTRDGTVGTLANGNCYNVKISANGRFLTFTSFSTTLVVGTSAFQIYQKDLDSLATPPLLISSTDGSALGQGDTTSYALAVTPDGRHVIFYSGATNLVAGSTGNQIYSKDTASMAVAPVLISSVDGSVAARGNASSNVATVSSDGRWVLFQSISSNLVVGATVGSIYRKDMQDLTAAPVLVSTVDGTIVGAGEAIPYSVSNDGRYLVITSKASSFPRSFPGTLIYRKDLADLASAPLPVLASSQPTAGIDPSMFQASLPKISADGRYVFFTVADAERALPGASGQQIFMRDLQNPNQLVLISSTDGTVAGQGNDTSGEVSISSDGRWVAFASRATNFGIGLNTRDHIYRKDTQNPALPPVLVSSNDGTVAGQGNNGSLEPTISDDGRYVAFRGGGNNLGVGGNNGLSQIFRKDLDNPGTPPARVSSRDGTLATQSDNFSYFPQISADGRYVTFQSYAFNLNPGSTFNQVYRKDMDNIGTPPAMASSLDGTVAGEPNHNSGYPVASRDGRYVAFASMADNLGYGAIGHQVYLKDMDNPGIGPVLVSSTDGTAGGAANTSAVPLQIELTGDFITLVTSASNLFPGVPVGSLQWVYRKKLSDFSEAPKLLSSLDGTPATFPNGGISGSRLTPDGSRLLFIGSYVTNLLPSTAGSQLYLLDVSGF